MKMKINKYDFKKKKYDKVEVGNDIRMYCEDMEKFVKCTNCKKPVQYGSSYSSLKYHNDYGLAYPVCPDCYAKEWEEKKKYEQYQN